MKTGAPLLLVALALPACASAPAAQPSAAAPPASAAPPSASGPWLQYASPAEAGFDAAALDRVGTLADSAGSAALMAVYRGRVIGAWGDVARELEAHSVRKSLLSGLYGIAVARGEIDLNATLADLAIDDSPPLTADERRARVRDLIASRSGVYHNAAYAPADQNEDRPERGSEAPGARFFYNNWDFNVAEAVYEAAVGESLFRSFTQRIARPLGMEDWSEGDGFLVYEPTLSLHPAHTFRISARDLARFGQLYLLRGAWDGERIIPESWIDESTRAVSDLGDGEGYGYMWWTYAAGSLGAAYPALDRHDVVLARGTGGQTIFVVPTLELVVVHRGDTDNGIEVQGRAIWRMVEGIAAARTGELVTSPRLTPLAPRPLASQRPAPPPATFLELDEARTAEYVGDYVFQPGGRTGRTFLFRERLFLFVPGLGDGELFALSPDLFTVRITAGVTVRFERDGAGRVSAVVVTYRGRDMRGERAPT